MPRANSIAKILLKKGKKINTSNMDKTLEHSEEFFKMEFFNIYL